MNNPLFTTENLNVIGDDKEKLMKIQKLGESLNAPQKFMKEVKERVSVLQAASGGGSAVSVPKQATKTPGGGGGSAVSVPKQATKTTGGGGGSAVSVPTNALDLKKMSLADVERQIIDLVHQCRNLQSENRRLKSEKEKLTGEMLAMVKHYEGNYPANTRVASGQCFP